MFILFFILYANYKIREASQRCLGLDCSSQLKYKPFAHLSAYSTTLRHGNGGKLRYEVPNKEGCEDPPILDTVGEELERDGGGLVILDQGVVLQLVTTMYSFWILQVCKFVRANRF